MFLKKTLPKRLRFLFGLAAVVLIVAAFLGVTFLAGGSATAEGRYIAEQSIRRAAVQCYALEGTYPPSLDYLVEHYGLSINDLYYVDYRFVAANLMPEFVVLEWVTDASEVID